uniref:Protein kinase domain-containing protein n=1 Tax=Leersia perrieri TaxID=77586 RepID=A0A0D9XV21_9ORYZ
MEELAAATMNFATDREMGILPDGREVAIKGKRVDNYYSQGLEELHAEAFMAEITMHSPIRHKHIVRLHGCCVSQLPPFREREEECLLVYEYMKNGSLRDHLHNPSFSSSPVSTSWKMRIEFLHDYTVSPVIHRDIKSSNILLDATWVPRLSDFGLSLYWDETKDYSSVDINGSYGYVDPEYFMRQCVKPTIDVYSFGVVMLEVLTGKTALFHPKEEDMQMEFNWPHQEKSNYMRTPINLVDVAVQLIEAGKLRKLLDKRPAAEPTPRQLQAVDLVAQTATRCVRMQGKDRPAISQVVTNLQAALELARCDG